MGIFGKKKPVPPPPNVERPLVVNDALSLDQLLAKKIEIDEAIKRRGSIDLDAFIARFQALTSSLGVSAATVLGIRQIADKSPELPEKKKREVKMKYRDPVTGEECSGRGKPPKWLQGYIDRGRDKDEFLIDKPEVQQEQQVENA